MVARFLSKYQLDNLLIEKEVDIGMGASSANSAILHAGYDALPSTNKALTNVMAVEMWPKLSEELGIAYSRCGDYVVAVEDADLLVLEELVERGRRNRVPGIEIISGEEMRRREPLIRPDAIAALWAPTGAISDPFAATVAAAENAVMNGVELLRNTAFEDFLMDGNQVLDVLENRCKRGKEYAICELQDPRRMVASTVRVKGGLHPLVPVFTRQAFPKPLIPQLAQVLRQVEVPAPVEINQVVLEDALGTGIDIVASRDMPTA